MAVMRLTWYSDASFGHLRYHRLIAPLVVAHAVLFCHAVIGTHAPTTEYFFIPNTNLLLEIEDANGVCTIGKLDADGNFRVEGTTSQDRISSRASVIVNTSKPFPAYEFRSGRLILGTMMPTGNFVPETGSKVIRFEDFKYSPEAPRIWNLPGYFLTIDEIEKSCALLAKRAATDPSLLAQIAILKAAAERKK